MACFVTLRDLEDCNFSTVLLENSRKHHSMAQIYINSYKASPFVPIFVLTHRFIAE